MNSKLHFDLERTVELRCGRNEHQAAALYSDDPEMFDQVQGDKIGYYDFISMDVAADIVSEMGGEQAFAVVHMSNPIYTCLTSKAFYKALEAGRVDLRGTAVATNQELRSGFMTFCAENNVMPDCVLAPTFEEYGLRIVKKELPELKMFTVNVKHLPFVELKMTRWGIVAQEADNLSEGIEDPQQLLAWATIKYARSYSVAFVKDNETVLIKHSLHSPADIDDDIPRRCIVATDFAFENAEELQPLLSKQKKVICPGMYFEGDKPGHVMFTKFGHLKVT